MKTTTIDHAAAKKLETFARVQGIVRNDEEIEILQPTFGQRVTAARKRSDLEAVYDVYVVRKAGEEQGTLVNLLRDGDYGTHLNILSGVSKLIGIVPGLGPGFQGVMAGVHGIVAAVSRWVGRRSGDSSLTVRSDATARFAANQLALAAVGFGEDALLSPVGSAVVRAVHNVPSAVADFKDARRTGKEGPNLFKSMSVEQVGGVSVGDNLTKLEPPPPFDWPRPESDS